MAVRIRLTRRGSNKNAFYRIVVADGRYPRDGRFLGQLGHYNPTSRPAEVVFDGEQTAGWLAKGATMTDTVASLYRSWKKRPTT